MRPEISVCIPVYKVEEYLPRCLDSVLGQSYQDFEIVCVNDASPDGSPAILREYAARDGRIRIVDKPRNEGLMMARKTGYQEARGQYVFFLDSDDFLPENALGDLYSKAKETGAEIVFGYYERINANGHRALIPRHRGFDVHDTVSLLHSTFHGSTTTVWGALFDRSLFDAQEYTAFMNHGLSEDRVLLTEVLLRCHPRVAVAPVVTYYYWSNETSITGVRLTHKALVEQFRALYHSYEAICSGCPELIDDNRHFLTRTLSYYIESGVSHREIKEINPINRELLRFGEMRRNVGLRLAVHTWMSMYVPGYSRLTHAARHAIRRVQGKE